jgi:type IV secretory pathway TrbL component
MTVGALESGNGPLLWQLSSSIGDLFVPSPWLVYSVLMILVTITCLALAWQRIQSAEDDSGS